VKRAQALTIGVLLGFVILACVGMVVLIRLPYNTLFPPTATAIPPIPTITPTPTLPNFLPTANLETPVIEPSATNTRVPTSTPTQPRPPTATVVFNLPTPRPTHTPIPVPTSTLVPTATPTPPSPTPVPRQFRIVFEADDATVTAGDCTDLRWEVSGAMWVQLDGRAVPAADRREVCPRKDTSYELTFQLPDSSQWQTRAVKIRVTEKEE
jgi:hypothetical protein